MTRGRRIVALMLSHALALSLGASFGAHHHKTESGGAVFTAVGSTLERRLAAWRAGTADTVLSPGRALAYPVNRGPRGRPSHQSRSRYTSSPQVVLQTQ